MTQKIKIGIIAYEGLKKSVAGQWLIWEATKHKIDILTDTEGCDLILMVYPGSVGWRENVRQHLKRHGVNPDAATRAGSPYILAGGAAAGAMFTCLENADACAVGEAYTLVRKVFEMVSSGAGIPELQSYFVEYPHAIERSQLAELQPERDKDRPWMLNHPAPTLAEPDSWVDWSMPPIKSNNIIRINVSRGCHHKCLYCATTYRQKYQYDPDADSVLYKLERMHKTGNRVQLISNDAADLPYFHKISGKMTMDSESFTIKEMSDKRNRRAAIKAHIRMARFGVEGISERLRNCFAKPIKNETLFEVIEDFARHGVNTHMFFIGGPPFETEADYEEFKDLFFATSVMLANTRKFVQGEGAKQGDLVRAEAGAITRIKFTSFNPNPPAPLARYVPGFDYVKRSDDFQNWQAKNCAARYIMVVWGKREKTHAKEIAEQFAIPFEMAVDMMTPGNHPDPFDMIPEQSHANRAIWEIIKWPISPEKRWKIADHYRHKMTTSAPRNTAADLKRRMREATALEVNA